MTRTEIIEKLKEILCAANDSPADAYDNITEESRLLTDLGLSSVSILFLVIAIEEDFSIQFDDVGVTDFNTVGDVVDYIERKLK
ncbi:MAG: acyl carrier protein [Clostridia bacterium]|nr:acyl carrier protein [Clostridia bacterium]